MYKVVIFGTGLFAQVAHFYLKNDSHYEVIAFTADKNFVKNDKFDGLPVVPFEQVKKNYPPSENSMFVAIGYRKVNKVRAQKYQEVKAKGYELITYVSSKIARWGDTKIGDNCFIFENQTIQPFVKIGNDVIIWSGNHIGHHATIGDHCFITSHVAISGSVKIGPRCFIGVNSTIRDGITIARENVIGAGALIMKDTKEREVYMGQTAKLHPKNSSQLENF